MASYFYQPLSFPVQKQYIRVHRAGVAEKPPVWLIPQLQGSPSKHFSSSRWLFCFQIYTQPRGVRTSAGQAALKNMKVSQRKARTLTGDPLADTQRRYPNYSPYLTCVETLFICRTPSQNVKTVKVWHHLISQRSDTKQIGTHCIRVSRLRKRNTHV